MTPTLARHSVLPAPSPSPESASLGAALPGTLAAASPQIRALLARYEALHAGASVAGVLSAEAQR